MRRKHSDYIRNNENFEVAIHTVACDETAKTLGWNAYIANLKTDEITNLVSEAAISYFRTKSELIAYLDMNLGKLKPGKPVYFK